MMDSLKSLFENLLLGFSFEKRSYFGYFGRRFDSKKDMVGIEVEFRRMAMNLGAHYKNIFLEKFNLNFISLKRLWDLQCISQRIK